MSDKEASGAEEEEEEAPAGGADAAEADAGESASSSDSGDGDEEASSDEDDDDEDDEDAAPAAARTAKPAGPRVTSAERAATEVFVGGLAVEATEEDLQATFSVAGDIAEIRVMRNAETGLGKGFAFVRYVSADAAAAAVEHLNGLEVCGRAVGVVRSQAHTQLFVGGLPREWASSDFEAALGAAKVGGLEEVSVSEDTSAPGRNRGFGFARFESHSAALAALGRMTRPRFSLPGHRGHLSVSWAREEPSPAALAAVTTVYVRRMPPGWGEPELRAACAPHGALESVVHARALPAPPRTDFGYVRFASRPEAEAALAALGGMAAKDADGVEVALEVEFAKPRAKEAAPGGRGAGAGRGRGAGRDGPGRGRDGGWKEQGGGRGGRGRGDGGGSSMGRLLDAMRSRAPPAPSPTKPAGDAPGGGDDTSAGGRGGRGGRRDRDAPGGGRDRERVRGRGGKRDFAAMNGGDDACGRGGGRGRGRHPQQQQQQAQHPGAFAPGFAGGMHPGMMMHPQMQHAMQMQYMQAVQMQHFQMAQQQMHMAQMAQMMPQGPVMPGAMMFGDMSAAGGYAAAAGYYGAPPGAAGAPPGALYPPYQGPY